jgi:hypothetical protein
LLGGLRTLRIFSVSLMAPVAPVLAEAGAAGLRSLDLGCSPCLDRRQPTEARGLRDRAGLAWLALACHGLGAGAAELAGAASAAALVSLDVRANRITASGAHALLRRCGQLRRLHLRNNPLGALDVRLLLDSPLPARLWWLDLRKTALEDAAALTLAASAPRWQRLAWLDLRGNPLSGGTRARLRAAFGPAVRV